MKPPPSIRHHLEQANAACTGKIINCDRSERFVEADAYQSVSLHIQEAMKVLTEVESET